MRMRAGRPTIALLVAIGLASCATSEPEPEEATVTLDAARLALTDGDVEGALRAHRTAIAADPTSAAAHTHLGVTLVGCGDVDGGGEVCSIDTLPES